MKWVCSLLLRKRTRCVFDVMGRTWNDPIQLDGAVQGLDITLDGRRIAAAKADGTIAVYAFEGNKMKLLFDHIVGRRIGALSWSGDGSSKCGD